MMDKKLSCKNCQIERNNLIKEIKKIISKKETVIITVWINWKDEGCGTKHLSIITHKDKGEK